MPEQRNNYKGYPERAWLRLGFRAPDGSVHTHDLLADTGCPYGIILAPEIFDVICHMQLPTVRSNFGPMTSGWIRLYTPELGLVEFVMAHGSQDIANGTRTDHPDLVGFVGLPVLRLLEYGGDYVSFWIRTP
jgi:hypothetical protein